MERRRIRSGDIGKQVEFQEFARNDYDGETIIGTYFKEADSTHISVKDCYYKKSNKIVYGQNGSAIETIPINEALLIGDDNFLNFFQLHDGEIFQINNKPTYYIKIDCVHYISLTNPIYPKHIQKEKLIIINNYKGFETLSTSNRFKELNKNVCNMSNTLTDYSKIKQIQSKASENYITKRTNLQNEPKKHPTSITINETVGIIYNKSYQKILDYFYN